MKFTVHGFSQQRLIELNLDDTDALILRYFIDFKDSGTMVKEVFDGEIYFWVRYENVIKELPILKLNKADSVYRRFRKLAKCGVLIQKTKRKNGTYSFFKTGPNYYSLVSGNEKECSDTNPSDISDSDENPNTASNSDINPEGFGYKSVQGTDENPEGYGYKSRPKDPSIKDSSIKKDPSTKDTITTADDVGKKDTQAQFKDVIHVFNNNIHPTTPLEAEKLREWMKDVEGAVIIKAIEESVLNNRRNLGYINGILNNWFSNNLKTLAAVEAYLRDWADKKNPASKENKQIQSFVKQPKNTGFHNFKGRTSKYTPKQLEQMLNGNG